MPRMSLATVGLVVFGVGPAGCGLSPSGEASSYRPPMRIITSWRSDGGDAQWELVDAFAYGYLVGTTECRSTWAMDVAPYERHLTDFPMAFPSQWSLERPLADGVSELQVVDDGRDAYLHVEMPRLWFPDDANKYVITGGDFRISAGSSRFQDAVLITGFDVSYCELVLASQAERTDIEYERGECGTSGVLRLTLSGIPSSDRREVQSITNPPCFRGHRAAHATTNEEACVFRPEGEPYASPEVVDCPEALTTEATE